MPDAARKSCTSLAVNILSWSCKRYLGWWSKGVASRICCLVHAAVGLVVTAKCSNLRLPWLIITSTYKVLKNRVGTVKKSMPHMWGAWIRKKVSQDIRCFSEGGFLLVGKYLAIVLGHGASTIPNWISFSRIFSGEILKFSRKIRFMVCFTSDFMEGRPGYLDFLNHLKTRLLLCHFLIVCVEKKAIVLSHAGQYSEISAPEMAEKRCGFGLGKFTGLNFVVH